MIDFKKGFRSFTYAWKGAKAVWHEEQNFQILTLISIVVIIIAINFHFSFVEFVFIIIAITMVLVTEAINTVFEDTLNKIGPNHDLVIGKIKDMAAFFLTLTLISAFIIGVFIFWHHFLGWW